MKFIIRLLSGGLFLLTASQLCLAADEAKKGMSSPPIMIGQVFLALLLVVGMILLMAWLLKKLGHGGGGSTQGRTMKVIAALPLGTREKAVLVQVGEQQMMLGVAPGRVNCLHVFDEPVVTPPNENGPVSGDFGSRFKDILAQRLGRS